MMNASSNCLGWFNRKYYGWTYLYHQVSVPGRLLWLEAKHSTVFEAHSTQYNIEWSRFSIDDRNVNMCCPKIRSTETFD